MKTRAETPATDLSLLIRTEERLARMVADARADAERIRVEAQTEAERLRAELDGALTTARAAAGAAIEADTARRLAVIEEAAHRAMDRYEAVVGDELTRRGQALASRVVARVLGEGRRP